MPLTFVEGTFNFPTITGRRQRLDRRVPFPSRPRVAQVVVKGFNVRYDSSDHHILELEIDLDSAIEVDPVTGGPVVRVFGDLLLRDSSGNIDDPYTGFINFVVIADVA